MTNSRTSSVGLVSAGRDPRQVEVEGPLFVDLDGTLVASDLLWESAMLFVAKHPFESWRILIWLTQGKARLKRQLAARCLPNPATLPYRREVLEFIRAEAARGRELVLATAGDRRIGEAVSKHFGFFRAVLASDGKRNLSGVRKLNAILAHTGGGGFGYVGDAEVDLEVWARASDSYIVSESSRLLRAAERVCRPCRVFPDGQNKFISQVRALRPNQWIKNLLLLVPLFAAHKMDDLTLLQSALLATGLFSVCASAIYILNDLLDMEGDRMHPKKCNRPFASGAVSIPRGILLSGGLLAAAFATSITWLPSNFSALLGLYVVLTAAYSLFFKRRLLQDVFVLAGLYTLRLMAGGTATGVDLSPWLLAFALFFFLSLAYLKRYSELLQIADRNQRQISGRNYVAEDNALVGSVGPASGYLAVMVLCLYINSSAVVGYYSNPAVLWLLCPVFLYWITRMWFLAGRRTLLDDPVVFAATDGVSLLSGVASVFIVSAAI
ncbi:MAG: 4-hydroxybenzoate polyprenyltransferase [Verrucomicrobia bacterium]|nr:MAG: 4-hydroxybenzoate polyprenyltransferase [Verrucomicrobiota bacterium]